MILAPSTNTPNTGWAFASFCASFSAQYGKTARQTAPAYRWPGWSCERVCRCVCYHSSPKPPHIPTLPLSQRLKPCALTATRHRPRSASYERNAHTGAPTARARGADCLTHRAPPALGARPMLRYWLRAPRLCPLRYVLGTMSDIQHDHESNRERKAIWSQPNQRTRE